MEFLRWIFIQTFCEYDERHYILDSGPIGRAATGEIAAIFMEKFQLRAVETSACPLNEW